MKKFIPRDKLSKKAKRELDSKNRLSWGMNPATKKVESEKLYNRKKVRQADCKILLNEPFFICNLKCNLQ